MKNFGQVIETLIRSEVFKKYERSFNVAVEMPLTLRPAGAWQLPFRGKQKEGVFCAIMAEQSATCAACLQSQEKLELAAMEKSATRKCAYGLSEIAVPVMLGAKTIGFLSTGQMMLRKPTEKSFRHAVEEAEKRGVQLDPKAKRAFFATPVVSKRKLEAVARLLEIFSDHLSMIANQLSVQANSDEPLVVVRTRQYIQEHYQENLSLALVSSEMHIDRFSLCKVFHKITGLTFTQFINRTRIEEAKRLFLNPNLNISEIGLGSGFQSLTHFNRMFKRIMGESPTRYRDKLPVVIYPKYALSSLRAVAERPLSARPVERVRSEPNIGRFEKALNANRGSLFRVVINQKTEGGRGKF